MKLKFSLFHKRTGNLKLPQNLHFKTQHHPDLVQTQNDQTLIQVKESLRALFRSNIMFYLDYLCSEKKIPVQEKLTYQLPGNFKFQHPGIYDQIKCPAASGKHTQPTLQTQIQHVCGLHQPCVSPGDTQGQGDRAPAKVQDDQVSVCSYSPLDPCLK